MLLRMIDVKGKSCSSSEELEYLHKGLVKLLEKVAIDVKTETNDEKLVNGYCSEYPREKAIRLVPLRGSSIELVTLVKHSEVSLNAGPNGLELEIDGYLYSISYS